MEADSRIMNDITKNIIAIIPARGGSKGVPRKNIRPLHGKPLIYYTIAEAKKSRYLGRILVSTEDREIAEIARGYGAEIIERPVELAQDDTTSQAVYQQVIRHLEEVEGYCPAIIVALQPTSPLRQADDIDGAIEEFLKADCDTVASVCEVEHPPQWMFNLEDGKLKPVFKDWDKISRRQIAPVTYRLNGAVYVYRREVFTQPGKGLMGIDIRPYIMPLEKSIDIDSEIDFKLAELLIND